MGVAAATALVGGALLYHYIFNDEDEEEEDQTALDTMLEEEKLNEVKKDARGTIEADYILKLMNFCAKTARKRRESEINESIA